MNDDTTKTIEKVDKNAELKAKFLEYFREVPIQKFAAGHIGRCEETIINWKKEDLDFSNCIEDAKAEFVKRKLGKVRSQEWILERVFKGDFAQRTELTGKEGKDLFPEPILGKQTVQDEVSSNNSD